MTPRLVHSLVFGALLTLTSALSANAAGGDATVDVQFAKLKSPDEEVRLRALIALQTSLDPRLPDALLKLLADEGNTIRRLAARGVGSRWWQISTERRPACLEALKRNAHSQFDDEVNMVRRAVGLLNRDYTGNMFGRSPNGRWVVYERFCLPCLIDTRTGTEELLGWSPESNAYLICSWGNSPLDQSVFWHPKKEIVGMTMLVNRKESAVWIWQRGAALRMLGETEVTKALGLREANLNGGAGFFFTVKGWTGDELRVEVSYGTVRNGDYQDHTAVLGWNVDKGAFRVIVREKKAN